jgi:hypothetical protein
MTDTRQRLAAKAKRAHLLQVVVLGKFARREAFTDDVHVFASYAVTIVLYLQQFQATILGGDDDLRRASVERIFEQLFDGVGWSLHHLASCNTIDHRLVEFLDSSIARSQSGHVKRIYCAARALCTSATMSAGAHTVCIQGCCSSCSASGRCSTSFSRHLWQRHSYHTHTPTHHDRHALGQKVKQLRRPVRLLELRYALGGDEEERAQRREVLRETERHRVIRVQDYKSLTM